MADETSPVIPQQHPSQQKLFNSSALNTAAVVVDQSPDDDHLLSDDDELSVGGTTPPPPSGGEFKDEQLDDKEDSVGPNLIKFSIDNILNPEFGVRMNAAESAAAAAVALHHHHQQLLIQQQNPHHQASPSAAAGFLGAFHQLPFLAAARQMILAAAASGSPLDYHHQQQSLLATQHPHSSANNLLLNHSSNTLNLVQSCTDKYLNSGHVIKGSGWGSHQPALPGGASGNKPLTQAGTKSGIKAQQVTTTNSKSAASPSLGKAIDLSVRNSASPPEYRQNNRSSAGVVGEKQQSTVPVRPQTSPSLASGSSNDDHSSAPSPTRSASVSCYNIVTFFEMGQSRCAGMFSVSASESPFPSHVVMQQLLNALGLTRQDLNTSRNTISRSLINFNGCKRKLDYRY